ncbi:MAG TPA: bifunctional 4-hydroxy-2-oxoglutarate aldolase/2-dehydro-3-deoxy-phosphogluconate aldolase [Steroidobacteraceae bacterium]|nr:bifunctional 4-hydroxy-2-oxoglutarate aldolase/2-dehydro-3-deoxy-phosphogluconate aldolase [Steroidobacteraceae bacterium]
MPLTPIRAILARAPVIPVLTITELASAVPLARALLAGSLPVLEVTLRSAVALDAIRALRAAVPEAIVGAGTVIDAGQLADALAAGSQFIVSPGYSPALCAEARRRGAVVLPGVATASELMAALAAGIDTLKFFPAAQAGGAGMLKALAAPFPTAQFCPTGGIDVNSAGEYLALPNVLCVGMSSLAPPALVAAGDFAAITALARRAALLRPAAPAR